MTITWTNFFVQVIAFGILYLLLSKYAFGPLFGIMEKRRQLVKEQIDTAERNRSESERFLEEQKQSLQQARKEAYDIIEQAKSTGSKQADDIISAARGESSRLKEEAVRDIEAEKNKAIASLKSEVGGLSVQIASKILEKQVDAGAQGELVDQYLKDVGKKS
ncbi:MULTISPECIES: F0F1 ATP synthase subunit B [Cohnella]|uniref:ATP synthase subunit b n=1 Tax=Cohnella hashimotonis TaxID=2826895 RepID=A0ABT6TVM2_9BACL|nr:F0F1 ATP synthase subunit B [Cohnella hashimotonis]MDI4650258.1 F0F1 ATP synthase subunit B [Cohnella hashimotonis]